MNFVADENVDAAVVRALREAGHEVTWIAEIEPAATDEQVLNLADEQRAVLVTEDKDFGELVYRRRLATSGVLLVRLAGQPSREKAATVGAVVLNHGAELAGSFAVVTPDVVRVRRPPER